MSVPIAVFAPSVSISITIEPGPEADDIHIHAGGQGIWVARMLRQLGAAPVVVAPVGGEAGRTLVGLTGEWGIDLQGIDTIGDTTTAVHDRRGGEREELARSGERKLHRHEVDRLYHRFLELALDAGRCVVTGPVHEDLLPMDTFRRLGADLAANDVPVAADLHGAALTSFLDGGPLAVLKVSSGDLVQDGRLADEDRDDDEAAAALTAHLVDAGVERVVVSRGGAPIFARFPEGCFTATGPELQAVDTKGSGDSMTAALTLALVDGLPPERTLARAWAAGAANVTRHGLASAATGLVDQLMERAEVTRWEG
jgi:1-phosphofructokinase